VSERRSWSFCTWAPCLQPSSLPSSPSRLHSTRTTSIRYVRLLPCVPGIVAFIAESIDMRDAICIRVRACMWHHNPWHLRIYNSRRVPLNRSNPGHHKNWVELLRSKFKRSTQKLSSISTDFDLDLKVDIEDRALGRQKMNWVLRSTLFNAF